VWLLGIQVVLVEPGAFKTGVLQAARTSAATISDYDGARSAANRTLQRSLKKGDEPLKVARRVSRIVQDRSPRFRHGVGAEARWIPYLRVLLSQRMVDALLRRSYGLARHAGESRSRWRTA
jgi:hypothetical protein